MSQASSVVEQGVRFAAPPSPASAYYEQRHAIAASSGRLRQLREAIADTVNLSSFQWAQWFAYTRAYKPDLVIELGRGNGNSTAAINEALHQVGHGRIESFCLSRTWQDKIAALIAPMVEPGWFDRVRPNVGDMLAVDFRKVVGDARRVLLIWDAHGFEIAALVLGDILPLLAEREHFVIMHDISDLRYLDPSTADYRGRDIFRGMERAHYGGREESRLCLGWICTLVDQAIAIVDFLSRNRSELKSADQAFHEEIVKDAARLREMQQLLSSDDWSASAHWAYFSLNELTGPYTFPRSTRLRDANSAPADSVNPCGSAGPVPIELIPTRVLVKTVARRVWDRLVR